MASVMSTKRLQKELKSLHKSPLSNPTIVARPLESNILEWHYLLEGAAGSPYEGGKYWGKLIFPKEYPLKPPGVMMLTPSGRFRPNRRLCLSMSDFHPESWNPMWSVATILTGLNSFMLGNDPTTGSMDATAAQRKKLAAASMDWNVKDATFCKLFPDEADEHKKLMAERRKNQPATATVSTTDRRRLTSGGVGVGVVGDGDMMRRLYAVGAGLVAVLSILFALWPK